MAILWHRPTWPLSVTQKKIVINKITRTNEESNPIMLIGLQSHTYSQGGNLTPTQAFLLHAKVLSCIYTLSPFDSEKKKKPQGFKAKNGYKQKNPKLKDPFYNQHNKLNRFECKFPANTFHYPRISAINSADVLPHGCTKDWSLCFWCKKNSLVIIAEPLWYYHNRNFPNPTHFLPAIS